MSLKLKNRWKRLADDWWEWEAFLDDEGSGELGQVDYVKYVLHPTFVDPVRVIKDPSGGFVLKTAGWGEFDLKAFVHMRDQSDRKLTHEIELKNNPAEGVSSS
jgi:transcription initiation factor IIF auxiliary subunit